MKGIGIYVAAATLMQEQINNAPVRPYVKPPKTKKDRANRAKSKKAKIARRSGRK